MAAVPAATYDGEDATSLGTRLGVPAVHLYASVGSTMDVAHALAAAGAPDGTVVLSDAQTGGRGRAGRRWASEPGAGVWLTVVTRPRDLPALEVLSLRVGLAVAGRAEPLADDRVLLKWPNDLLVGRRKLAGILIETRWRDGHAEWAAVGVGMNVSSPVGVPDGVGLRPGTARVDAVAAIVTGVVEACARRGALDAAELAALGARDAVRGRRVVEPVAGRTSGVTPTGLLRIEADDGRVHLLRQASVTYADHGPELPG